MFTRLQKKIFSLFCWLVFPCILWEPAGAQTTEEMAVLRMFYPESDLVVSATRAPKPISQTAEDLTVVTAREIRAMNAHSVAEVLRRVPGLFLAFNGDFGGSSLIAIQGSDPRQVLVKLDGVTWNFLAGGTAEVNTIPVEIIDRIEIIKGPASSAWGSSLGGVINIITKPTGNAPVPTGSVQASYGKGSTQDYRAQAAGRAGDALGYYLYAGKQRSDGIDSDRYFDTHDLYAKVRASLSDNAALTLSMGYSSPDQHLLDVPNSDLGSSATTRVSYFTVTLDGLVPQGAAYNLRFYHLKNKFSQDNRVLGTGMLGEPGDLLTGIAYDETSSGASGGLNYRSGLHNLVFGTELEQGDLEQTTLAGPLYQSFGIPASSTSHPEITKLAFFLNDTLTLGDWSLTPGIRWDENSVTGSFVSPSLGATYRVAVESLLRASVARGFTIPPLSVTSGGGLFLDPNPNLQPEKIWSYQLGFETAALKVAFLKADVFRHEVKDTLERLYQGGGPPAYNDIVVNGGESTHHGFELSAESVPLYNLSLLGGLAYVHYTTETADLPEDQYSLGLGLRYRDNASLSAELYGQYVWWNLSADHEARYDDFIWDFTLTKRVWRRGPLAAELFTSLHNLFDGAQYQYGFRANPGRWAEAGVRFGF